MGLNAAKKKIPEGNHKKAAAVEAGNYLGRLVQIVDLGLQTQRPFKGEPRPPAQEVMLTYELGTEFMLDEKGNPQEDKPRWLSETIPFYNLGAVNATSTKRINVLDPDGIHEGDLSAMTSLPCTVTVVTNIQKATKEGEEDKIYTDVGNITPPMKGFEVPELKNDPRVFDLEEPDMEVYKLLPQWVQQKLKGNLEFQGSPLQKALGGAQAPAPEKEEPVEEKKDDTDNPY